MKRFFTIVGTIDRRIIFLLIGLSVLIPLIKPNWLELPIKIDNNTQIVYDSISDLQEGNKVLLSFEYGASTKPEVHPMAVALLKHLFAKGIKVYIVSLWPEGPIMAKLAMDEIIASDLFNIEDGKDYIMFDYKVGCTSIMVTDAIPYVESCQLKGILAGMPGAAEYEKMVYDYLTNELTNNNEYINENASITKGKAFSRMSAQSVAHLVMVIFILLGNLSYYYQRKRG